MKVVTMHNNQTES